MVDKIVAKVDNYIVLKSEVDKAYLDYVTNQGGRGNPDEIKCQFGYPHSQQTYAGQGGSTQWLLPMMK